MILTTDILKEKYKDYSNPIDKIKREVDQGHLIRIVRGVFETKQDIDPIFLAGSIISPSYISFDYALSYYGLIPERVYVVTSASLGIKKNKSFVNNFGRYEFSDIPCDAYPIGLNIIENDGYYARIACKEKALCDSVYKSRVVKSIKNLKILLFEDKRIDIEEFRNLDMKKLINIAKLYKKTNLELLIKLINKEYF